RPRIPPEHRGRPHSTRGAFLRDVSSVDDLLDGSRQFRAFGRRQLDASHRGSHQPEGQDHQGHRRDEQRRREAPLNEDQQAAAAHGQRLDQVLLQQRPQDERENHRCKRPVILAEDVPNGAEHETYRHVEHAVPHAIGSQEAQQQDQRAQDPVGDAGDANPQADERRVQNQQDDVADVEARDDGPDEVGAPLEQERPRVQSVDGEPAEQQRQRRRGRDAERHQRDEAGRAGRVVGRFRRGHTLDGAFAETLGPRRHLLLGVVGDKYRDAGGAPRQEPEEEADAGATQDGGKALPEILAAREDLGDLLGDRDPRLFDAEEDFRDREQADDEGNEINATVEILEAKSKTRLGGGWSEPDQGEEVGDKGHRDPPRERGAGQRDHGGEGEHHEGEILRGTEAKRLVGEHRREERQRDDTEGARDERADRRHPERDSTASLLRHWIAVPAG